LRGETYRLLQIILKVKIEVKRGSGRRQISGLKNIGQWIEAGEVHEAGEILRLAEDRDGQRPEDRGRHVKKKNE